MDLKLFPKNEEWGTADEALDLKLSFSLKKASQNLSFETISEFYDLGMSLKTRAYNPMFLTTIELVVKGLLFYLAPNEFNDFLYKKLKGHYFSREKIIFNLKDSEKILKELKQNHKFRYLDQIDFYLGTQKTSERNPYIEHELKKSTYDLQVKIIFKEFKNFLSGELVKENYDDPFLLALKDGSRILVIENFMEIWFDHDQLFSLACF